MVPLFYNYFKLNNILNRRESQLNFSHNFRCRPAVFMILTPVELLRRRRVTILVECDNKMRIFRLGLFY